MKRELGTFAAKSLRQRRGDRRLQRFEAEDGTATGAMKMRVPMSLIDPGVETPDTVGTGHAVRQLVRHQPVQSAVKGHPVVLDGAAVECRPDFVVREWATSATQDIQDGNTRPCRASTARYDARRGVVGNCFER